jgi:localization factor PodJL
MTSGVPWHLRGVRPEVLDSAREAARRSGLSIEEWLDTVISESAKSSGIDAPTPRPADLPDRPQSRGFAGFADITARLDALARQVDGLTHVSSPPHDSASDDDNDQITEVLERLDRKIDRLTELGGSATPPPREVVPSPSIAGPEGSIDQALAEIEARMRVLDGGSTAPTDLPRAPTQSLPDLEQQLRQINARIDTMRPCNLDSAVDTLRDDLAEIGVMLKEAMPRKAIEALEVEVRSLASRIDDERHAGADTGAMAGVERGLAEVRDALRALTPAESLVGFEQAVQGLSQKVDRIAGTGNDPDALKQLEGAIVSLRGVVSHVASNDTLAQLSNEVRALSAKVDQVSPLPAFSAMEQRIAQIADALERSRGAPVADSAGLETMMRSLTDKVDQLNANRADQPAIGSLEERIMQLVDKLDASDARFENLAAIERGLADLVKQMESQRTAAPGATASDTSRPSATSVTPAVVALSSQAALPFPDLVPSPPIAPEPSPTPRTNPLPSAERRPIDPDLPPDHPLEPGAARARAGTPAERIAASEAALEDMRPPVIPDPAGKSNFIAAARRAAQAATSEAPLPKEKRSTNPAAVQGSKSLAGKLGGHIRKLMVGASVIVIVLGVVYLVTTRLLPGSEPTAGQASTQATQDETPAAEPPHAGIPTPSDRQSTVLPPGLPMSPDTSGIDMPPAAPTPDTTERDSTGSIQPQATPTVIAPPSGPTLSSQPSSSQPPARNTPADRLPPVFGHALRAAAANGDAAAEFEIATRYADGRGVPQSLHEAAAWFERAAHRGLAPAQFRLGGLYEKGTGVPKNLDTARRLYIAAAEAGHAKAMHNLAVLYAEGVEGRPNYATAARWFRNAAEHGIVDSQYNLAVLYARGIGVETNLAEAFKWFALASREGDRDAAKKRDEIAARLDRQTLTAAMATAQSWQAQPQPEDAIQVRVPPGGWDAGPAPSANRMVAPKADNPSRRPAQ